MSSLYSMPMYAIRGAVNCHENTSGAIDSAVIELFTEIQTNSGISEKDVISIIVSATKDITAKYPCETIRKMGYENTALLCVSEMDIDNSLPLTVRVLIHCHGHGTTKFFYCRDTAQLRK